MRGVARGAEVAGQSTLLCENILWLLRVLLYFFTCLVATVTSLDLYGGLVFLLLGIILKLFYGFSCFEATVVRLDLHGSLFSLHWILAIRLCPSVHTSLRLLNILPGSVSTVVCLDCCCSLNVSQQQVVNKATRFNGMFPVVSCMHSYCTSPWLIISQKKFFSRSVSEMLR
ncbi:hypothetical protein NP493_74g03000 [Ridgeia piscesae]|uniref:Uncharacterized protein n=1 Tax=Ridgeia piscesae TaxID=27915 RepID=A0AAD9P9V5_RIDPI|nr:hypothetical protein NP493_74g03000 [Ridgeia piscesae]